MTLLSVRGGNQGLTDMRTIRLIPAVAVLLMVTGCEYDRSFLRMNSDSGVPFLGLQLLVDSDASRHAENDPAIPNDLRKLTSRSARAETSSDIILTSAPTPIDDTFVPANSTSEKTALVPTSDASPQLPRVRLAIPDEQESSTISTQDRLSLF